MFQKGRFGVLQAPNGQIRFAGGAPEQEINFCLQLSRLAQKDPKWSKTLGLAILVPFGPHWNVDKPAMFGPSPVMNDGPQSKKKAH